MTTPPLINSISRPRLRRGVLLIPLALAWFALSPVARAVDPPPDGGYAGNNTAEGDNALFELTTGTDNTAIGDSALFWNNGSFNTATGALALANNGSGQSNTATGYEALYGPASGNLATGSNNTANGYRALYSYTTGSNNIATCHILFPVATRISIRRFQFSASIVRG